MPVARFHPGPEGYARRVSTYDWLLMIHVTGAFLLFAGGTTAGILNVRAWRAERPSEIALLMRLLQRVALPAIGVGSFVTLLIGLWLVHEAGYSYGAFWVLGGGRPLGRRARRSEARAASTRRRPARRPRGSPRRATH